MLPNLPRVPVNRIMWRALPPHDRVSDDALETVQECTSELSRQVKRCPFVHCHEQSGRLVIAEDLVFVMQDLGLDNYAQSMDVFINRYSEGQRVSNSDIGEPGTMQVNNSGRQFLPPPRPEALQQLSAFMLPEAILSPRQVVASVATLPDQSKENGPSCSSSSSNSL